MKMNRSLLAMTTTAALLTAAVGTHATAAAFSIGETGEARVGNFGPGDAQNRDENNGGTNSFALIGVAAVNSVENFGLFQHDLSALAGQTLTGDVTLTLVLNAETSSNGGGPDDSVYIQPLFNTNAGWVEGALNIGAADNNTDDGSVSFANFAQYNDNDGSPSGTTIAWKDAGGSDVANLLGALDSSLGSQTADTVNPVVFTINQAIAQDWIDNGLAGLVVRSTEGGGATAGSRFFAESLTISGDAVPEPASLSLVAIAGLIAMRRRRG